MSQLSRVSSVHHCIVLASKHHLYCVWRFRHLRAAMECCCTQAMLLHITLPMMPCEVRRQQMLPTFISGLNLPIPKFCQLRWRGYFPAWASCSTTNRSVHFLQVLFQLWFSVSVTVNLNNSFLQVHPVFQHVFESPGDFVSFSRSGKVLEFCLGSAWIVDGAE